MINIIHSKSSFPVHTMKVYRWNRGIALLILNLGSTVDIGERLTPCHTPATLPPGNKEVLME
jgi:hypothetical protein